MSILSINLMKQIFFFFWTIIEKSDEFVICIKRHVFTNDF